MKTENNTKTAKHTFLAICTALLIASSPIIAFFIADVVKKWVLMLSFLPVFLYLCFAGRYFGWWGYLLKRAKISGNEGNGDNKSNVGSEGNSSNELQEYILFSILLGVCFYCINFFIGFIFQPDSIYLWTIWSYISLVFGMFCAAPIIGVVYLYMAKETSFFFKWNFLKNVSLQIEHSKFSILAMYGALFISLILLFSQSLYFYDEGLKKVGKHGLYMIKTGDEQKNLNNPFRLSEKKGTENVFYLYFTLSNHIVEKSKDDNVQFAQLKNGPQITEQEKKRLNSVQLRLLVELIKNQINEGQKLNVTLTGSTDITTDIESERSKEVEQNKILVKKRVKAVWSELLSQGVKERAINLEKEFLPNQEGECIANLKYGIELSIDDCRYVKVSIKPQGEQTFGALIIHQEFIEKEVKTLKKQRKDLEFLDYVYFTTYTITTTGYGDIVPVQQFPKFVTILANLIEVLFLTVMISLLISHKQTNGKKKQESIQLAVANAFAAQQKEIESQGQPTSPQNQNKESQ